MVWPDVRLSRIMTRPAFRNAVTAVLALGGSTNAIIHLIAMTGRLGVPLGLDDFDELARTVPLLAGIHPAGEHLMEDFFYAGGLPTLLAQLGDLLDTSAAGTTHPDRAWQVAAGSTPPMLSVNR